MIDSLNLSNTQLKICSAIASGLGIKQLPGHLGLSPHTIKNSLEIIYDELERLGYRRNITQLAVLFMRQPDLFKIKNQSRYRGDSKKFFAIQMLKTRCHYKNVSERLELSLSSVAVYKSKIPKSEFYTLPYLKKLVD